MIVTRELENIKRKIVCEPFTLLTVLVLNNDTKPQTVLNGKGLDDPLSGKLFSVGAIKPKEFLEYGASNLQDGKYPFYLQSEPNVKGELVVVSSANK